MGLTILYNIIYMHRLKSQIHIHTIYQIHRFATDDKTAQIPQLSSHTGLMSIRYQNVSILDDGNGGDNWSYEVQSSSQIVTTNKPIPIFLQARCHSCDQTMS